MQEKHRCFMNKQRRIPENDQRSGDRICNLRLYVTLIRTLPQYRALRRSRACNDPRPCKVPRQGAVTPPPGMICV